MREPRTISELLRSASSYARIAVADVIVDDRPQVATLLWDTRDGDLPVEWLIAHYRWAAAPTPDAHDGVWN